MKKVILLVLLVVVLVCTVLCCSCFYSTDMHASFNVGTTYRISCGNGESHEIMFPQQCGSGGNYVSIVDGKPTTTYIPGIWTCCKKGGIHFDYINACFVRISYNNPDLTITEVISPTATPIQ